ncbi:TetR/AcrR family transcriptional regulator [Microbispora sp. H11081]|uniref:TetR/AcrR family transcriptional regulator n=1 Tax=Microbispora sp. H11081 TaxID=2729107 RepID=UPI001474DC67|nr:TetR/AcrR family transcriptional regulator [Microbispora sp. H11081]
MAAHSSVHSGPATRARVLDEAISLFIEMGFTRAPMSEIASRLGITKAALYYYFASKDDLLIALVSPLLDRIDELLAEIAEAGVNDDLARRQLMTRYAALLRSDMRVVGIISRDVNVSSHPEIAPRTAAHVASLIELLAGPDADAERMARASAAMTVVQRGLFVIPGEPALLRSMPRDARIELVLQIAFSIVESSNADNECVN